MGLFGSSKPCDKCVTAARDALEARERADSAVRQVKDLANAFEETQDYVRRMTARVTRREQREASQDPTLSPNDPQPNPSAARPLTIAQRLALRRNHVLSGLQR